MPNLVTPLVNAVLAQHPAATIERRGYDHVHFDLGGAARQFVSVGGGLHYLDGGVWQAINTDFANSAEVGYADAVTTAASLVHVDTNTARKVYPRRDRLTEYFVIGRPEYWTGTRWQALNLPGRVRSGQSLTWDGANIAFTLQHTGHGVKYDVTLKNATNATNVRWPLELVGLTWDNWTLISATTGQVVMVFPLPTLTDAARVTRAVTASYSGGYITFTPDYSGLVYPVVIDPTLTQQPDATAGVDCMLYEPDPTANYATFATLWIGGLASNGGRGLILFDLSSLPVAPTYTSIQLTLWLDATPDGSVNCAVNRILAANSSWTEAGACWSYRVSTTAWAGSAGCSTSGTDYSSTDLGTFATLNTDPAGTSDVVSLNATEFEAMRAANYGLVVRPTNSASYAKFRSSDNATAGERPKLVVDYTAGGLLYPALDLDGLGRRQRGLG